MPSRGAYSNKETENGMLTGLLLVRDIRAFDAEVPIFILTSINIDSVLSKVQSVVSEYANVFVLRKNDYPPSELSMTAKALLERERRPEDGQSILRRLWRSMLLQPNVSGIGIDFKKFVDDS